MRRALGEGPATFALLRCPDYVVSSSLVRGLRWAQAWDPQQARPGSRPPTQLFDDDCEPRWLWTARFGEPSSAVFWDMLASAVGGP